MKDGEILKESPIELQSTNNSIQKESEREDTIESNRSLTEVFNSVRRLYV